MDLFDLEETSGYTCGPVYGTIFVVRGKARGLRQDLEKFQEDLYRRPLTAGFRRRFLVEEEGLALIYHYVEEEMVRCASTTTASNCSSPEPPSSS